MENVVILGGKGEMGFWFARFFEEQGCEVVTIGRTTAVRPEDVVSRADIVLVSVPIPATEEVIRRIAPLTRRGQLLMDLTSLKTGPIKAMLETKADVIGLHPLFSGRAESMHGQNVVMCPVRPGKWKQRIRTLLTDAGASVLEVSPEKHDVMMAVVQGLTHFRHICAILTLKKLGIEADEILRFSSIAFRIDLGVSSRILSQNPELRADLQLLNPSVPRVLAAFKETVASLKETVETKDRAAFLAQFHEASAHAKSLSERDPR